MQSLDNVGQTKWILLIICLYAYGTCTKRSSYTRSIKYSMAPESNGRFKRFVELKATLSRNGIMRIRK